MSDQVPLRLPPDLVRRLDDYAARLDLSRSAAAASILSRVLNDREGEGLGVAAPDLGEPDEQSARTVSGQTAESGGEAARFGHILAARLAACLGAQRVDGSPGNEFILNSRRVLLKGSRRSQLLSTTEAGLRRNAAVIAAIAVEPDSSTFDVYEVDARIILERSTVTPQGQRAVRATLLRNVGRRIGEFILGAEPDSDEFIENPASNP